MSYSTSAWPLVPGILTNSPVGTSRSRVQTSGGGGFTAAHFRAERWLTISNSGWKFRANFKCCKNENVRSKSANSLPSLVQISQIFRGTRKKAIHCMRSICTRIEAADFARSRRACEKCFRIGRRFSQTGSSSVFSEHFPLLQSRSCQPRKISHKVFNNRRFVCPSYTRNTPVRETPPGAFIPSPHRLQRQQQYSR